MILMRRLIALLVLWLTNQYVVADQLEQSPVDMRLTAAKYEHGREGVKQDYQQAFELYCRAALKGDAESAYGLGFMYFNGRGISRNLAAAMYWFKQAADGGDVYAGNMLSRFKTVQPVDDGVCKPEEPTLTLVADNNPNRRIVKQWVDQIAPFFDIDPELVMAVIRAESAYNVRALSNKNAQGLMQLIPETAERFGVNNSWDPIQNIKGGTAYLHWLLRHFDGKVEWVLAAYNAGEKAVERYHGVPPYKETRAYVKKILAWYPKPYHPIPSSESGKVIIEQKI